MTIQPITLAQLDRLSVDDATRRLYWDGKEVVTTMTLPWYVNFLIIVGVLAALVSALWPIFRFYQLGY